MTDLVERLRTVAAEARDEFCDISLDEAGLLDEAAGEIVRLRLQVEDMKVSVAGFKQMVREWEF